MIQTTTIKPKGFYERYIKRLQAIVLSLIAIIILSPILLITYLLVRVKFGKPAIFIQKRVGKDGKVVGMEFKGTDDDTKLYVECDKVIFAVGQMPGAIQTIAPVDVDERGMIVIDEDFNTSVKGVFAAGDISKAKADKTACYATALGKKVAESIDKYMQELEDKVSSEAF